MLGMYHKAAISFDRLIVPKSIKYEREVTVKNRT